MDFSFIIAHFCDLLTTSLLLKNLCVLSVYVFVLRLFQLWAEMAEVEHASACFVNLIDNLTS